MNHFIELGFPVVPTPNAPEHIHKKHYNSVLGDNMDLSGGVHFAFRTTDMKFAKSEIIKNVDENDYIVVEIQFGDELIHVFSPFPLDEQKQFVLSKKAQDDFSTSEDPEERILTDRNVYLEKYQAWKQNMYRAMQSKSSVSMDTTLSKTMQAIMARKPLVQKHASYMYVNKTEGADLGWEYCFTTSMADPLVQGLESGQVLRKTHVQHWLEKTLVYLHAMQTKNRLGAVTVSLDGKPVTDWTQIAQLHTPVSVKKIGQTQAAQLRAVCSTNAYPVRACKNDQYKIYTTESNNFVTGITALSEEALQNESYKNPSNWKNGHTQGDAFGVAGLYIGEKYNKQKTENFLEDHAFDALSNSATRFIQQEGTLYLAMSCGDFGEPLMQILKNKDGEIIGVRQLIWPDAFDHSYTANAIEQDNRSHNIALGC